jgi:hypothetical protein
VLRCCRGNANCPVVAKVIAKAVTAAGSRDLIDPVAKSLVAMNQVLSASMFQVSWKRVARLLMSSIW